jgi:hypothetical protein
MSKQKMFGGLCFMMSNHMSRGIVGDTLMARVGPDNYDECLSQQHAREIDFTGKALKGVIHVSPEGLETDQQLEYWLGLCERFVRGLPPEETRMKQTTKGVEYNNE